VDGTAGKIDMRAFLSDSNIDSTIFEPLRVQIVPDRQVVEKQTKRLGTMFVAWQEKI
jgi:hypothetical protein